MKKTLTLSIITFISIFMIGTTLVTAGGVPFEALQRQIDDLQQQIDNLQNLTIEAFATTTGIISQIHHELPPETEVDLLTLELPAGKYVSNITLQAHYIPFCIVPRYVTSKSRLTFPISKQNVKIEMGPLTD